MRDNAVAYYAIIQLAWSLIDPSGVPYTIQYTCRSVRIAGIERSNNGHDYKEAYSVLKRNNSDLMWPQI